MTDDTPPVLYISADTSDLTTRYKATPRMHMAAKAWYPEETVEALREALEFYADEKNYEGFSATDPCGCCSSWYEPKIHATEDNGTRARAALAALPAPDEGEQDEGEE